MLAGPADNSARAERRKVRALRTALANLSDRERLHAGPVPGDPQGTRPAEQQLREPLTSPLLKTREIPPGSIPEGGSISVQWFRHTSRETGRAGRSTGLSTRIRAVRPQDGQSPPRNMCQNLKNDSGWTGRAVAILLFVPTWSLPGVASGRGSRNGDRRRLIRTLARGWLAIAAGMRLRAYWATGGPSPGEPNEP